MPLEFAIVAENLQALEDFNKFGTGLQKNIARALNTAARDYRTEAARRIRSKINLPAGAVSPRSGNLSVSRRASVNNLESRIRARGRPRGLASYSNGGKVGRAGVAVSVTPATTKYLPKAFLIRLRGLDGSTAPDKANIGLAVRLGPGQRITNKLYNIKVGTGLYLLYGPSLRQVFLANSGEGVAKEISPAIIKDIEAEIIRLAEEIGTKK